jgi:hypothetical protein
MLDANLWLNSKAAPLPSRRLECVQNKAQRDEAKRLKREEKTTRRVMEVLERLPLLFTSEHVSIEDVKYCGWTTQKGFMYGIHGGGRKLVKDSGKKNSNRCKILINLMHPDAKQYLDNQNG